MSDYPRTLSGPDELVAQILDGREHARRRQPEIHGDISDEGVRQLILLSYYASQAGEEGRYPRFRIYVPPMREHPLDLLDPWQLTKFSHPIPLGDVDDLRRLAPSVNSHDFALEIHERTGAGGDRQVECVGLRLAHSGESGVKVFSTSLWARRLRPGLMIRVDGPGELRASETRRAWDLRAGKLVELGGLPLHPLPTWHDRLSRRFASTDDELADISQNLHFAWNELLHQAAEQRRGGNFVVLPDSHLSALRIEDEYRIHLKYPTANLQLGRSVANLVRSCRMSHTDQDAVGFVNSANQWLRGRHGLLSQVEGLARLSGVDGCTVFDADLELIGFGGKIDAPDTQDKSFRDAREDRLLDKDIMSKTGTRHRSAYRLCHAKDGVTCYVVSQDGHVTAFWSDRTTVYRWSPYWPWSKMSDHF
jgi:hypothetical protein